MSGEGSVKMSIPVLFEKDAVGNAKVCAGIMFVELVLVVGKCLFTNSLIGTTIQDGGKRERSNQWVSQSQLYNYVT